MRPLLKIFALFLSSGKSSGTIGQFFAKKQKPKKEKKIKRK